MSDDGDAFPDESADQAPAPIGFTRTSALAPGQPSATLLQPTLTVEEEAAVRMASQTAMAYFRSKVKPRTP